MNYLPYCGSWFYGGASVEEIASFYCSHGLLADAPEGEPPVALVSNIMRAIALALMFDVMDWVTFAVWRD